MGFQEYHFSCIRSTLYRMRFSYVIVAGITPVIAVTTDLAAFAAAWRARVTAPAR